MRAPFPNPGDSVFKNALRRDAGFPPPPPHQRRILRRPRRVAPRPPHQHVCHAEIPKIAARHRVPFGGQFALFPRVKPGGRADTDFSNMRSGRGFRVRMSGEMQRGSRGASGDGAAEFEAQRPKSSANPNVSIAYELFSPTIIPGRMNFYSAPPPNPPRLRVAFQPTDGRRCIANDRKADAWDSAWHSDSFWRGLIDSDFVVRVRPVVAR